MNSGDNRRTSARRSAPAPAWAIESSDVTLISGALTGIVTVIRLSRATMRDIRRNLFFAFAYNVVGTPIAARRRNPSSRSAPTVREGPWTPPAAWRSIRRARR
jgi:hypothetical protein